MLVSAERADVVTAELWDLGTSGLQLETEREPQVMTAYFEDGSGAGDAMDFDRLVERLTAAGAASVERTPVPDVDWVARFRDGFRAFRAAPFQIVPAWQASPAQRRDPRTLVVDPGGAFGTGSHETTRLCLAALERRVAQPAPPRRILDLGTGSGILAVAARKLGCRAVVAIDEDPRAAAEAVRHGDLNRVALQVLCADLGRPLQVRFPLVVANLHAALLSERRDEIAGLVSPGGHLVLSGLLTSDVPELRQCYSALGRVDVTGNGEWAALEVTRER